MTKETPGFTTDNDAKNKPKELDEHDIEHTSEIKKAQHQEELSQIESRISENKLKKKLADEGIESVDYWKQQYDLLIIETKKIIDVCKKYEKRFKEEHEIIDEILRDSGS